MPQNREKLFGADIKLFEHEIGEDFVRGARGDLTLTEGVDNIVQALTMRLKVRKGELAPLGWPSYGSRLYELIGEPNNIRTHVILMAHARNAIDSPFAAQRQPTRFPGCRWKLHAYAAWQIKISPLSARAPISSKQTIV